EAMYAWAACEHGLLLSAPTGTGKTLVAEAAVYEGLRTGKGVYYSTPRIDLETVKRFHLHQKADYWFHDEVDQQSLYALSQYLPNGILVSHVDRLDEYSFRSSLPSSLCLGWIADGQAFDLTKAKQLTEQYRVVRHLLIGEWYPLTPFRARQGWLGSQYHRNDLGEGMILVFRREGSPETSIRVRLRGLENSAVYELRDQSGGSVIERSGASLTSGLEIAIPNVPGSTLLVYRRKGQSPQQ
ncbi:MAG: hypothetical protein NTU53_18500, partial [Planctomycetota bacterium]|nr:hypothetical protein [Planctomycetota bacterium]